MECEGFAGEVIRMQKPTLHLYVVSQNPETSINQLIERRGSGWVSLFSR